MNLSYWEKDTWFSKIDFAIIGSGIVGLSCALSLRKKYPYSKIVVFEKGMLPSGASTKNAGFACFGSISEILDDLKNHTEEEVVKLARERAEGLQLLRKTLGDEKLDYQPWGGYELFLNEDMDLFNYCKENIFKINELLSPVFQDDCFSEVENTFQFQKIQPKMILNQFEGQINTGKMMMELLKKASAEGILILNNAFVTELADSGGMVHFTINSSEEISASKVFIATNGFAGQFIKEEVIPARAQVLITEPIPGLAIKGTFHLDRGYYYFRNLDNRILFGGGRNLNFSAEQTTELQVTELIQNKLEELLATVILPRQQFKIAHRWSGIMGVGHQKKPIVREISNNVFCGVRMGGMGVSIGSTIGRKLSEFV